MKAEAQPFDHHGGPRLRGLAQVPRSRSNEGKFGRLFRTLKPFIPSDTQLKALAASMASTPAMDADPARDNPDIPAGYTYLGQFVDHDITFDAASALDRLNDPNALTTFRTPRFDLDSLYGGGRTQTPFLYDEDDPVKLLVGANTDTAKFEPVDLPRNQQGRALIGDPRNDVHVIVSQMHLAFIRFHNAVVDHLRMQFFPDDEIVDEARRLTCWHYQWIVVHDFVGRLVGPEIMGEVLVPDKRTKGMKADLRFYSWNNTPFMPVEFSGAAYRFGHSMVRPNYKLNDQVAELIPVFSPALTPNPLQHLGLFRPLPKTWTLDWKKFFPIDGSTPQLSRRIDTSISSPLHQLPASVDGPRRSLALLNLMRGRALELPSGQAVAAAMGTTRPNADLHLDPGDTPIYFYFLREAEVLAEGRHLGPTAGRIVAEVLLGMLKGDPSSYLRKEPRWVPELPSANAGTFTMADLLKFAGVA